jgi:hypothetical protein
MAVPKSAAERPTIEPLSDRLRKRLAKHLPSKACPTCGYSARGANKQLLAIGKQIGISGETLRKFVKGKSIRSDVLDKISAWLDEQAIGKSS